MLCRHRRQQRAGRPLVDIPGRSIIGTEPREITPSFRILFARAVLHMDWSTSHGHFRVSNPTNRSVE